MANFQTHLNGGSFVSAATTLALNGAGLIHEGQSLAYFALGVMGSLLPDIDSDSSKPASALFSVLGAALAFVMTLPLIDRFLPLEVMLIWLGVFLCVRFLFFEIFARITVHRGIWHSWLGIAVAVLGVTNIARWLWELPPQDCWIAGVTVGIGYLTHLVLDEVSSVDLSNVRVKRSFGSALKPMSLSDPRSSAFMLTLAVALAVLAPASDVWEPLAKLAHLGQLEGVGTHLLDQVGGLWGQLEQSWGRWWRTLDLG